jgi:hypothetical protein
MKTKKQPFDYEHHDLAGHASVDFPGRVSFQDFAVRLTGYNPDRFSPVALRFFVQKGEPVITLYALDKSANGKENKGKLPVKKFKSKVTLQDLLQLVKRFDFTVSDGEYDLSELLVKNK